MTEFTPVASTVGGLMIGTAAVLLMASHGRIAGISGIAVRMLPPYLDKDALGRVAMIAGLILAPVLYAAVADKWASATIAGSAGLMAIAGLLVGCGSVWGNGCTSGHGICGLSRLSVRSLAAVATFMTTAAITVYITRHLI
jgi:hypothetical protein